MAKFDQVFKDMEIKKPEAHPKRITKWIHYTKLIPNKKQYRDPAEQRSREEALAVLIQADGEVLQDLIVRKTDADEYEIIAGHTRCGACRILVEEEGKKQYEFLPCIVKDISEVRAAFQVYSSNGYSEKTQYEKMHEIEEMKHLIETYPEEFPELQKGRMVERLSKHFKIDKSTIGEYLQISHNLGDEAMELFEKGKLKKSAAVKLSSLEKEEQRQLVKAGITTTKEIELHKQTRKVEKLCETVKESVAPEKDKEISTCTMDDNSDTEGTVNLLDYNNLFAKLQKDCDAENCCNAFAYITLGELKELNYLLDRLLLFCENIDEEELEDFECGSEVFKLYRLADTLFARDL